MQSNPIAIRGMAPYLQVYDMPASLKFYRDQLGFQIVTQSQPGLGDDCDWVLLKWNETELMLNTIYEKPGRPPVPDPARAIGHSDVVLYFSCPDIDGMSTHLRSKGLDIKEPQITGYHFKAIQFSDPDGYGICFHWPVK
jgi:catechol 2,3-dioxygenase-like lactoylglutathione lyase family enzyme